MDMSTQGEGEVRDTQCDIGINLNSFIQHVYGMTIIFLLNQQLGSLDVTSDGRNQLNL